MSETSKRLKREADQISEDLINDCSAEIINQILCRMPIKDAVRTSILSRDWRYKWHTLQDLVFDDRCYWGPGDWRQLWENFGRAIKEILDVHPNTRKFELTCCLYSPRNYLDDCINTLSTKSIQEIVLNLLFYGSYPSYETPSDLYKCQHLVHLKLIGCVLIIPPSFEGFMSLVTLYLPVDLVKNTNDSRNELEILISRCLRPQHLSLKNLHSIFHVNVKAPRLESLEFEGSYPIVDVVCAAPNLKSVTDSLTDTYSGIGLMDTNLHKFLLAAPCLRILKIERHSLKYLAVKKDKLPHALAHLECLYTCIDFTFKEEVLTIIYLMRRSPELKKLEFQARPKEEERLFYLFFRVRDPDTRQEITDFWQESHPICRLEKVEIASLDNISGSEPELQFIRFLLNSLPNLKTVKIRLGDSMVEGKTPKDLLQFASALTGADVLISNPVDPEAIP